ncbi:MAG: hemolysin family protein [Myxococcota bacterium]
MASGWNLGSSSFLVTGDVRLDGLLLFFCLLLSAFFSSSETALTALSESKARQLIDQKPHLERYLRLWLDRPNRVLTTVLIGNNLVNTVITAVTTLLAQYFFQSDAVTIAVASATIAILIVGEITPKTFAKQHATALAPVSMRALWLLYQATKPVVVLFTWISKLVVKLFGGELTRTGPFITEEDIAFMIRLGSTTGVIEPEERAMLDNVFEFGETLVREVMVPRPEISALKAGSSLADCLDEIKRHGHTRLPVYGEDIDDVIGFLHAKDLLTRLPDIDPETFDLMPYVRQALFVPELEKISELLKRFQRGKTHLAVVVDEHGGTAGIVSLEDLLEELVGDIHDEHDEEEEEDLTTLGEGRYLALGRTNIFELGDELDLQLPDEVRYDTLAGFLIAQLGKMPQRGARVLYQGWSFQVQDVDQRKINRVEIERAPREEPESSREGRPEEPRAALGG